MDTRKTNNKLASDDDSNRSDCEDVDAISSSAMKRKWASLGGSDDVIEIDSSSDSETNTDESDDDDVVEIITNSNDIEDDDGLPAEGEKGEECHPNSNSEFNDSHDDVAHAEGEIDDEGSNVHNESDADYESNIDESKKDRELSDDENDGESNSIGKDANAIDNHEEEVEDIINNDELDNHNDAIDMMDDNNEELGVTDDSVSERDYSSGDEDDIDGEIERYHVSKIEKSKLTMVAQGFRCQANSHQSAADDDGRIDQATTASESNAAFDPTSVEYHGRTYRKNHCYVLKGREMCTVGVKRFTSNNTALCILIVRFDDTILGIDVEGSDYKADYMMGQYVQVHNRIENVSLSRFDREAESVKCIPRLIYSDQTPGKWYTFGYFYDRAEIMQRRGKKRQDMRSLEIFAGAGGSMLGYKNNGFVTVMAVENDSDAVATLRLNNPETNVYEGCIRKFIDDYKTLKCALGRIDHVSTRFDIDVACCV